MMTTFTAQLGSFDFAEYVRVGEDGMDPYSRSFEEPAWSESPFGEGQALSNVDSRNREMSWPLYLNDASKDELHALVRDLNRAIRYPDGQLTLTWQDEDASDPTYYDVAYARLEPEFRFRQSAAGWLAGTLRVWCSPGYGHTGTYRVIATAAATGRLPVHALSVASLAGDVDADVHTVIGFDSGANRTVLVMAGVAPVDYEPYQAASDLVGILGASHRAQGSAPQGVELYNAATSTITVRTGQQPYDQPFRTRLLAHVRSVGTVSAWWARDTLTGERIGPTAVTPTGGVGSQYILVDLGVYSPVPASQYPLPVVDIEGGRVGGASLALAVAGVYWLPEDTTVVAYSDDVGDFSTIGEATFELDSHDRSLEVKLVSFSTGTTYTRDRGGNLRGQVPQVPVGTDMQIFAGVVESPGLGANVTAEVRVRERFTFAR